MSMSTIDLSNVKNPQVGDEVVIFSNHEWDINSLVSSAKTAGTIPYELLVHLAETVKRIVT